MSTNSLSISTRCCSSFPFHMCVIWYVFAISGARVRFVFLTVITGTLGNVSLHALKISVNSAAGTTVLLPFGKRKNTMSAVFFWGWKEIYQRMQQLKSLVLRNSYIYITACKIKIVSIKKFCPNSKIKNRYCHKLIKEIYQDLTSGPNKIQTIVTQFRCQIRLCDCSQYTPASQTHYSYMKIR